MGRYVVTRAEPGASATALRLTARGHEILHAPMLRIEWVPTETRLDAIQAIAFTSANGVHAFARIGARRDLPVYCVGDATASAARDAGMSVARSASGDVTALAALMASLLDPAHGRILHVAGADRAGDLAGMLRAHGHDVETRVYYKAVASDTLPGPVADALQASPPCVDGILFHSARGGEAFLRAASTLAHAQESFTRIAAFCMSDAVADSVRPLTWRQVSVAAEPTEAALLALLPAQPVD